MATLMLADLEHLHDVLVAKTRGSLRLDVEPLDLRRRGESAGPDQLDRHGAAEALLPGIPNFAHAAFGDLAEEHVIPEVSNCFVQWRGHARIRAPRLCRRCDPFQ